MWLERFGTVDQGIFIGFGVITGIIVVLGIINTLFACCGKHRPPGHSVTLLLIYSTVVICATVLFRGVQTSWGPLESIRPLCPVFTALMLVGYTTFAASVAAQSWALLIKHKWNAWHEWKATLTVWIFVTVAGVAVIVWVVVFSPDVTWRDTTEVSAYNQSVYVCGGWGESADRDYHQFAWRVSFSVYFAFILLLAIISIPFHLTFSLTSHSDGTIRTGLMIVIVNATVCVIIGLIVWFQLHQNPYDDSYKYAIIGSLQLWMVLLSQLALLVAQVRQCCCRKSYSFSNHDYNEMSLKGYSDKVSVSDGDGALNTAMTADYYE